MLLQFRKAVKLQTKPLLFDQAFKVSDTGSLEQLQELTSRRRAIKESMNKWNQTTEATSSFMYTGLTSRNQKDQQKVKAYLPLLQNLVDHIESFPRHLRMPSIQWSTALSSSCSFKIGGPKFYRIDNMRFELGMSLFLYGAILRERAFETLSTDIVEAATFFRKAAGVYTYLSEIILPALQLSLPRERPVEAITSTSSIMRLISLADAQALAIKKAEERGTSLLLLSKLHYGVSQLLGEANSIIVSRADDSRALTSKLTEFLSTCSALHKLKSRRYLAEDLRSKEQIGTAIALMSHALAKVKKVRTPRKESWRSILSAEVSDTGEVLRKLEHENDFVWNSKIPPADMLPDVEGKIIVSDIAYEPQKSDRKLHLVEAAARVCK